MVSTGLLVAGWLVVSGPAQSPATVSPARLRDPAAAVEPAPGDALGALAGLGYQLELPPRETFLAVLERPLFAPSRRRAVAAGPEDPVVEPVVETPQAGRAEPPFRLVGTVGGRGWGEALVAAPQGGALERVAVGARIAGWLVSEIGIDHVVVEREGERRRLAILR